MTNQNPKITVLMSAHNAGKYIGEAIKSILNQTFSDFEFLIIDDASTDSTLSIIKSFNDPRIKIIENEKNLGLTKSLNIGLRKATGKYIARLDADDLSKNNRLEVQYNFMEKNNTFVLIGTSAEVIGGGEIIKKEDDILELELIFKNPILHSTIFFKKLEILTIGGYDKSFVCAQDYDLYTRLIEKYKIKNIPNILCSLRKVPSSIVASPKTQKIVHKNAIKISRRNIEKYIEIDDDKFNSFRKFVLEKNFSEPLKFLELLNTLKIIKTLQKRFPKSNTGKIMKRHAIKRFLVKLKKKWNKN